VALRGPRVDGPFAPEQPVTYAEVMPVVHEIKLVKQRPGADVARQRAL